MDGHFVPNLTYGMPIVEAVRRLTQLPLDVHLMISDPLKYARDFHNAGADLLTFHVEAVADAPHVLREIQALGAAAGVALNPGTPLASIEQCLNLCDLVLVMSVDAGFGGQSFNEVALDKLRQVRQMAPNVLLEVDGGVNDDTIARCASAGAQLFVVGSAIFRQPDYGQAIQRLASLAALRGNK
jgi:ribulose-phosphate 3-epimerase